MNKKITTLLASTMLAAAFSAGAAIENGKSYLLQKDGTMEYLSAVDNKNSAVYGQLELANLGSEPFSLSEVVAGTWTAATKTTSGGVVYTFVNKATGLTLSVDPATASYTKKDGTVVAGDATVTLGAGSVSEWTFKKDIMMSYFKNDSVVYFDSNGKLWKDQVSKVSTGLKIKEFVPSQNIKLNAADLNTLMRSVASDDNFFALSMTPEVSKGKVNHLTATGLHAEAQANGYIRLQAKDKKNDEDKQLYVVVDTAYYEGTETSGQLLKYTYDVENAKHRNKGSYDFKFTYNVKEDKLFVQVREVVDKIAKNSGESAADYTKRIKENNNNSAWSAQGITPTTRANKYIYMAKLDGTYVLTLNTDDTDGVVSPAEPSNASQNITIKTSADYTSLKMTTLADGVYLIQRKTTGGNAPKLNNTYALANLAGSFAWSAQARNQELQHMPAAQWVVKKKGTSNIAPVSITNREFDDRNAWMIPSDAQLFAVEGKADQVFFFRGSVKDTVSFIKVADELVKDAKLGYKYVSSDDAMVQTFTFNYLHGLAVDKYVYTPAGKDSIVRVDENGAKSNFRLELVVKDDKYGYNDELVRNVYYISDGQGRYLSYDYDKSKYMMERYPTPFFIKENNCIDGKHYYSLVEANLAWADNEGKEPVVVDSDAIVYIEGLAGHFYPVSDPNWSSRDYASGVKVSVDDNTLDLVNGDINDKFIDGMYENRTSAFAVEIDDSPLYRRFNNENLGEKEGTLNLSFVEKIRGEYLMDEWNEKLQDKTVDYAGIWNKDKAEGKLAFVVDTAWVNRGLGYIKPQYLISVARNDQEGTPGVPCTYEHNHYDNAGNKVDAAHCSHATKGHDGFRYGKYLVSFGDSAIDNRDKSYSMFAPYMDVTNGYTRVGFVEAIHYGDSLIILTGEYEKADPAKLDVEEIIAAYKEAKTENLIVDLTGDNHKNVTWSFRYVTPSNDAVKAAEEGTANEFLFESNIYEENGYSTLYTQRVDNSDSKSAIVSVSGKATKGFTKTVGGSIAPAHAAWLKMQNGCLVLTRGDSKFEAAKTGSDGALIFNAYQKTEEDDMVTSNDEIAAEGIAIVAGNGTVTVQGAAGKSVVITNILGKVVAETVLTSDNATIAVPAGIIAVAVDGEEAVKAIVK
ncbi:DUF6383 domain-containing protein [Parabacteroides sp.]